MQPRTPAPVTCIECERRFSGLDAPAGPRKHSYWVTEITAGLMLVGQGVSYRAASAQVRAAAHTHASGWVASPLAGSEFGLVADWVELFAPAIGKELLPARWPDGPGSTVVLDALPMVLSGKIHTQTGMPMHGGGGAAWTILAGAAYYGSTFTIVRMRAVPGVANALDWKELLVSAPGQPERVISDDDKAIRSAVGYLWPQADWRYGWDKLRRRLRDADDSTLREDKRHSAYDVLGQCAEFALEDRRQWINFLRWARVSPRPKHTTGWIRRNRRLVHRQLRLMPYWPGDTGPLEQRLAEVRNFFLNRKGMIRNRDRTNLLLGLMGVAFNGNATKRRYRELIRQQLAATKGVAPRHSLINASPRLH